METHASQVSYAIKEDVAPRYRFSKITSRNIPTGEILSVSSAQRELLFELPSMTPYNLKRSRLVYTLNVGSQHQPSSGGNPAVNNSSWIADDVFQLSSNVELYDPEGLQLVNDSYAQKRSKIMSKLSTSDEKFREGDVLEINQMSNTTALKNPLVAFTPTALHQFRIPVAIKEDAFNNYNEVKHFDISPVSTGPGTGSQVIYKSLELGNLSNTLFSQDKDIMTGKNLFFKIMTPTINQFGFASTQVDSSSNSITLLDQSVSVYDIHLQLAVEDNKILAKSVMEKFNSGSLSLRTDTILATKSPIISQTPTISINIPASKNAKLKRIVNCVYNGNEIGVSNFDTNNFNGMKISNYQTFIGQDNLQYSKRTCLLSDGTKVNSEDYLENKRFLSGSVYQNHQHYVYDWFHCDDFASLDISKDRDNTGHDLKSREQDTHAGLDLTGDIMYKIEATTTATQANPLTLYSFAVISRVLALTPQGNGFV